MAQARAQRWSCIALPMSLVLAATVAGATPAAAVPLSTEQVAPGVFVHVGRTEDFTPENAGGIANLGFVVGERAVAVIDSGGSLRQGTELLEAVRARTALPIGWVIGTHVHPDHVLGNGAFAGEGAVFVGHHKLARRMAEAGPLYLESMRRLLGPAAEGTTIIAPTLPVADRMVLDLGGRALELRAWPTAHTDTDLTVLDTATGTLFAGDLVFVHRIPVVDGSLAGWLVVLDELARVPAQRVVPGHGPASAPWPQAIDAERGYLLGLRASVREALARNRTLEQAVAEVAVPPGADWALVPENHPRNVTAAFTELEWE